MRPATQIYQRATSVYGYCFVRGQIIDDFNLVITEFFIKKKMIKVVSFVLEVEKSLRR